MEHNRLQELLRRSGHRIGMSAILPGGIMGTAIDDRMLSHTDAEELYWKDRHEEIERRADEIIALPMGPDKDRAFFTFFDTLPPLARIHATAYVGDNALATMNDIASRVK
jgi:hypothetical protein